MCHKDLDFGNATVEDLDEVAIARLVYDQWGTTLTMARLIARAVKSAHLAGLTNRKA